MSVLTRIANRLAGTIAVKPHALRNRQSVITFTLDDVPRSGVTLAGGMLARSGCAGTFYVAGGLTDGHENGTQCHSMDDLRDAARDGHELASHGWGHIAYASASTTEAAADVARNDRFFAEQLAIEPSTHFSYPFGSRTVAAKAMVGRRFATGRGVRPGVNHRVVDLADLRANALYASSMSEAKVASLVADTAARAGWLIFYTHDVDDSPTPYGVTPGLFAFALRTALASGCRVLPMRNALGAVSYR